MVWLLPSRPSDSVALALRYSDQFNFPLNLDELWFWQPFTRYAKNLLSGWPYNDQGYFFLKNNSSLIRVRHVRAEASRLKWQKALQVSKKLKYFPWIQAVFATGALTMDNCSSYDDIDIMIITSANSLWIVRVLVVGLLRLLGSRRRPNLPEHSSARVSDKICDNLYLDTDHLIINHLPEVSVRNFYLAHEILQAKCIFDRGGIHHQFLLSNSWVKKYLPIAYHETLKQCNHVTMKQFSSNKVINFLLFIFNFLLFTLQYLYMHPHLTSEKIGLGYAFFHPRSTPMISLSGDGQKI